jgi:hypothetical protein
MIFISKDKTGRTSKRIVTIEITPKFSPWHGGPIRPFGPPEGFFK